MKKNNNILHNITWVITIFNVKTSSIPNGFFKKGLQYCVWLAMSIMYKHQYKKKGWDLLRFNIRRECI